MKKFLEMIIAALLVGLIIYFLLYRYFLDWFCYIRSEDFLKCEKTFICKSERMMPTDPVLHCSKKQFFLFEKDSFFYDTQTYKNIYNSYIKSLEN